MNHIVNKLEFKQVPYTVTQKPGVTLVHALLSSGNFTDSNQAVTFITFQLSNYKEQHQTTTNQNNHNTPGKSCASCKGTRNKISSEAVPKQDILRYKSSLPS